MIDDVGHPDIGLLIEPFHVWDAADLDAQIARVAGLINAVQISDSPTYPRSIADRLPPGEGDADLPRILAAIEAAGYVGSYDCEIVSDDGSLGAGAYPDSVWKRTPESIVRSCVEGAPRALTRAATASASDSIAS